MADVTTDHDTIRKWGINTRANQRRLNGPTKKRMWEIEAHMQGPPPTAQCQR
jgi:hypothetical protein